MKALAVTSAVQLVLGLMGLRKALRDRTSYDVWKFKGDPKHIERDHWVCGTNLSAPGVMLVLQGLAIVGLLVPGKRRTAAKTLCILGAIMSGGYPGEKSVRQAWRGKVPDRAMVQLTASATALAVLMGLLGWREVKRLPKDG
ncbi:hypothetical protein FDW83_14420 [Pseudarthrobacter sp. NamE2]|uniref:hypothetical protein n=1 Tax=Pseudarthrobacter sp. NamE2 TaxID=2576838 RepID=UPI0010FD6360|nr:hypothetical protein [Pseudarthrobacter sp. NamE2]TLM81926.1 hypothetical protein FDW83_14420 [Pseudarthrobacter sp. NamE2]